MSNDYSVWSTIVTMALLSMGVACGAYATLTPAEGNNARVFLLAFSVGSIALVCYQLADHLYSEQAKLDRRKELADLRNVQRCPDFWTSKACGGKMNCKPEFVETDRDGKTCVVKFGDGAEIPDLTAKMAGGAAANCSERGFPWLELSQRCEVGTRSLS